MINGLCIAVHTRLSGRRQYNQFDGNCVLISGLGPIGICMSAAGWRFDSPLIGTTGALLAVSAILFLVFALIAERRALTVIAVKQRLSGREFDAETARNWYYVDD